MQVLRYETGLSLPLVVSQFSLEFLVGGLETRAQRVLETASKATWTSFLSAPGAAVEARCMICRQAELVAQQSS